MQGPVGWRLPAWLFILGYESTSGDHKEQEVIKVAAD